MRFAVWESPLLSQPAGETEVAMLSGEATAGADTKTEDRPPARAVSTSEPALVPWRSEPVLAPAPQTILSPVVVEPVRAPQARDYTFGRRNTGGNGALGHANLLRMGYFARPANASVRAPLETAGATRFAPVNAQASARELRASPAPSRWSIDAWALWREGGNVPLVAGQSSYGRSQAGAVVRYWLGEANGHAPQLHLRGTSALEGVREREVAFGGSARPVPSLPLRVALEGRVSETESGTELRAAGYAVTELPPVNLPGGVQGEAYAQAGYVTGDFATPFVDGQARITRPVQLDDDFRLEAGAGVWGGAQDDAARLDIGPTAGVTFRIGPARGRVSADYRFRMAGNAEPASGPALTLTAGF